MKTLKTFLFASYVIFSLMVTSSCKKEVEQCNCGTITDDDIVFDNNGNMNYTLSIKNDCSGNTQTFYFTQDVWYNNHVGDPFCVSNVGSWLPVTNDGSLTFVEVENKEVK